MLLSRIAYSADNSLLSYKGIIILLILPMTYEGLSYSADNCLLSHKGIILLILPMTYEGLAGIKRLILYMARCSS